MTIIRPRLSARSTKTPASGPTSTIGTVVATSTPVTASGAQGWPFASAV